MFIEADPIRECDECRIRMFAGFVIDEGRTYYCTTDCLYKNISPEDYAEMYNDGNGESYWTNWQEEYERFIRLFPDWEDKVFYE